MGTLDKILQSIEDRREIDLKMADCELQWVDEGDEEYIGNIYGQRNEYYMKKHIESQKIKKDHPLAVFAVGTLYDMFWWLTDPANQIKRAKYLSKNL